MAVVERLSQQRDGSQKHPRLLEQYGHRVRITKLYSREAGRAEVLRLHRSGMIRDEVMRTLESDLDLQELAARTTLS